MRETLRCGGNLGKRLKRSRRHCLSKLDPHLSYSPDSTTPDGVSLRIWQIVHHGNIVVWLFWSMGCTSVSIPLYLHWQNWLHLSEGGRQTRKCIQITVSSLAISYCHPVIYLLAAWKLEHWIWYWYVSTIFTPQDYKKPTHSPIWDEGCPFMLFDDGSWFSCEFLKLVGGGTFPCSQWQRRMKDQAWRRYNHHPSLFRRFVVCNIDQRDVLVANLWHFFADDDYTAILRETYHSPLNGL